MRLVKVTWVDIIEDGGDVWQKAKKTKPKLRKCVSVGWLVQETDEVVCLAQARMGKSVFGRWIYPKGCILEIETLEGK